MPTSRDRDTATVLAPYDARLDGEDAEERVERRTLRIPLPDVTSAPVLKRAPAAPGTDRPPTSAPVGPPPADPFLLRTRLFSPPLRRVADALRPMVPALTAYAAVRGLGVLLVCGWGWAHGIAPVTRLGTMWDAAWYARVVDHGYAVSDGRIGAHGIPFSPRAFFPLYPAVARVVGEITGLGTAGALVLTAWAASVAAACGILAIAARLWGRQVGLAAVVLWGVLPLAAVESMGYSESLFTALCAWCLYAVIRERWLTAGLLCLLAGLARPSATALIAAVLVAAALDIRRTRAWRWRPVLAAVLAPLGWLGYIGYVSMVEGSLAGYFRIQAAWDTGIDGGWSTLCWYGHEVTHLFAGHAAQRHAFGRLPIAVTGLVYLALLVACLRQRAPQRQPVALLVFGAGMMAIDFVNSSPLPPIARFLLPAFPLLYPAAHWLAARPAVGRWLLTAAAVGSACYGVTITFHGGAPS